MIFVLKATFHFGSIIYRSVSGMRSLSSVNNGFGNSKQFILCLFIFSIREYSCKVSQMYLRLQKRNDCCIIFYYIFTLGNDVFLRFSPKKFENFGGLRPLNPHQGFTLDPLGGLIAPPRPPADVLRAFGSFLFCFAKNRCAHIFSVLSPEEVSNQSFTVYTP